MVVARLGKFSVFAGIAGTHTFMCHFMIAAAIPTLRTTAHDLVLCLQCWSHVLGFTIARIADNSNPLQPPLANPKLYFNVRLVCRASYQSACSRRP